MSNQFKIGDIAVFVARKFVGLDCEIMRQGRHPDFGIGWEVMVAGHRSPHPSGCYFVLTEWIRKKRPPEQPSAFSYDEIISMCNDKSITDIRPTETQVREGQT